MVRLEDCPACREGVGSLEHEGGWCVYVECLQCGAHTAHFPYRNDAEREQAEQNAAHEALKLMGYYRED